MTAVPAHNADTLDRLEPRLAALMGLYPQSRRNMDHVIINALSDLRHLAARHDVDFLYCDAIAYQIHLQEKEVKNSVSPVMDEE